MTRTPLHAAVVDHHAALLTVLDLANLRAERVQFERPRAGLTDVTHAGVSDPTGETVADADRLRVRATYLGTIAAIQKATADLRAAEAGLRAALVPYGEDSDDFPERPADPIGMAA